MDDKSQSKRNSLSPWMECYLPPTPSSTEGVGSYFPHPLFYIDCPTWVGWSFLILQILVLLQFLQIRFIWWATYLCLEAFMPGWHILVNYPLFYFNSLHHRPFLSWSGCIVKEALHVEFSARFLSLKFSTASICFFFFWSPHTHFWAILGLVTTST